MRSRDSGIHEPRDQPESDSDSQIVARVQRGDVAAFDALVRKYLPRALGMARRILLDTHDAEDLVHDAFLRALDRIHTFDTRRPFAPWFFRLLVNAGLNARKSRALRAAEWLPTEIASSAEQPDEAVERQEIRERFSIALSRLPPRQRAVVTMFELDGLPTVEIATALGIAPETVRWHLSQARQTLRAALQDIRP